MRFRLSLRTLLECLQVFGPGSLHQTDLHMSYAPGAARFRLQLEEHGVLTTCEIATVDDGADADGRADDGGAGIDLVEAYHATPEAAKAIMRSEPLREVMADLDQGISGAAHVALAFVPGPARARLELAAEGTQGRLRIEVPKSSELFQLFETVEEPGAAAGAPAASAPAAAASGAPARRTWSWRYSISTLLLGMRALSIASETFLRINAQGVMLLQHLVETGTGQKCYVDFLALSVEPDEDDDDAAMHDAEAL